MNLLLVSRDEAAAQPVVLTGRRARHAHDVLHAHAGDTLRVGVLDGPLGEATVQRCTADALQLDCRFEREAPPAGRDTLVLAVPRPKVLARCLAAAAALGYGRILLFRSWRVDRSHLGARVLQPEALRAHLIAGLEQGMRTRLPELRRFDLFKPFVEDHLDALTPPARVVAHPAAPTATAALRVGDAAVALAIGPEGGLIPYEVEALAARGFIPVSAGPHPLRVETALAYLSGQLALLRSGSTSG